MREITDLAEAAAELHRQFPKMRGQGSKVVAVLLDRCPRAVTHDGLANALRDLTGAYPTREAIVAAVKHARKNLPPGVTIQTIYGDGYALVNPKGWTI